MLWCNMTSLLHVVKLLAEGSKERVKEERYTHLRLKSVHTTFNLDVICSSAAVTSCILGKTQWFFFTILFSDNVIILHYINLLCLSRQNTLKLVSTVFFNRIQMSWWGRGGSRAALCRCYLDVFLWDVCKSHLDFDGMPKLNILNSGSFWMGCFTSCKTKIFACSFLLSNASTEVMTLAPQKHANQTAQAHIIFW